VNRELDPAILGKLLLIQSTLHVIPDEEKVASFLCNGLSRIPGIRTTGVCLFGELFSLDQGFGDHSMTTCNRCRVRAEQRDEGARRSQDVCALAAMPGLCCIEIATAEHRFGFVVVEQSDADAFSPYRPFVDNTANLLALIIENRRQYRELLFHRRDLESKVHERTRALRRETRERKAAQETLRQVEKMQAVGQLAAGIAHDYNNQLAAILGYADMLRERVDEGTDLARYADKILLSTRHAAELTNQLLAFARKGKYRAVPVDLHGLIADVAALLGRTIDRRITITRCLEAPRAMTRGDPSQIRNALMNLGLNARDAMPDGGELLFATAIAELDESYCRAHAHPLSAGRYVRVTVTDTGRGMDEETKRRMFEPFFTTKEPGKGTGMGLASVYGTVQNHGGTIEVETAVGRGTMVALLLPLVTEERPAPGSSAEASEPARPDAHILLVDDEQLVAEAATEMLERSGYRVSVCANGREAVAFYEQHPSSIDLVVLDMVMPEMDGAEAFGALRELDAGVRVLLSSGYSLEDRARQLLEQGAAGFIQKPYRRRQLCGTVAELLKGDS
jgi:signal transduction histidine kinase/CheY-like chemotaxis protein